MNPKALLERNYGLRESEGHTGIGRMPEFIDGVVVQGLELSNDTLGRRVFRGGPSSPVANTADLTAFDVASSIPANTLKVGDIIEIEATVLVNNVNATPTLDLALKLDGEAVVTAETLSVIADDAVVLGARVHVDAANTLVQSLIQLSLDGGRSVVPIVFATGEALDVTSAIPVVVEAEWSAAHANNSATLAKLMINILRYP